MTQNILVKVGGVEGNLPTHTASAFTTVANLHQLTEDECAATLLVLLRIDHHFREQAERASRILVMFPGYERALFDIMREENRRNNPELQAKFLKGLDMLPRRDLIVQVVNEISIQQFSEQGQLLPVALVEELKRERPDLHRFAKNS